MIGLDRANIVIDDKSFVDSEIKVVDVVDVSVTEFIRYGTLHKDRLGISILDTTYIDYGAWWLMDDHYGVDMFPHSEQPMEYYKAGLDRAISLEIIETVKIIDVHQVFTDRLNVSPLDAFVGQGVGEIDNIRIVGNDITTYGFGTTFYAWTAQEWDKFHGYPVGYEGWFLQDSRIHDGYPDEFTLATTKLSDSIFSDVRLLLLDELYNNRYGIDEYPLDEKSLEYLKGDYDRSFDTEVKDALISINTRLFFGDSLNVLATDNFVNHAEYADVKTPTRRDGIIVNNIDTLMFGIGTYEYIWDAKEWEKYGYEVPYENWKGLIPYDETPYDELGFAGQGDLSQVTTGVYDYLTYHLNLVFKENIGVRFVDVLRYQRDIFRDSLNTQLQDRIYMTQRHAIGLDRSTIGVVDKSFVDTEIRIIEDSNVSLSEFVKYGSSYKNILNIGVSDTAHITYNALWLNDRYGVDMLPHSEETMEYYNDSFDRAFKADVTDNIKILDTHIIFKDSLVILSADKFFSGRDDVDRGAIKEVSKLEIVFGENLDVRLIFTDDRYSIDGIEHDFGGMEYDNDSANRSFLATAVDKLTTIDSHLKYTDKLDILTSEYFKVETMETSISKDMLAIIGKEAYDIRQLWLNDRYGVDEFSYDEKALEYYSDSLDRAVTASIVDEISIDTKFVFVDKLEVFAIEGFLDNVFGSVSIVDKDEIIVANTDALTYGIGRYDYIWDAKEWEKFGYEVPYENWKGLIPHDETPYDELGLAGQGDLSQVSAGVYDYLTYQLNFIFKESIGITLIDTIDARYIFRESFDAQIQDRIYMTQRHTVVLDSANVIVDDKSFVFCFYK